MFPAHNIDYASNAFGTLSALSRPVTSLSKQYTPLSGSGSGGSGIGGGSSRTSGNRSTANLDRRPSTANGASIRSSGSSAKSIKSDKKSRFKFSTFWSNDSVASAVSLGLPNSPPNPSDLQGPTVAATRVVPSIPPVRSSIGSTTSVSLTHKSSQSSVSLATPVESLLRNESEDSFEAPERVYHENHAIDSTPRSNHAQPRGALFATDYRISASKNEQDKTRPSPHLEGDVVAEVKRPRTPKRDSRVVVDDSPTLPPLQMKSSRATHSASSSGEWSSSGKGSSSCGLQSIILDTPMNRSHESLVTPCRESVDDPFLELQARLTHGYVASDSATSSLRHKRTPSIITSSSWSSGKRSNNTPSIPSRVSSRRTGILPPPRNSSRVHLDRLTSPESSPLAFRQTSLPVSDLIDNRRASKPLERRTQSSDSRRAPSQPFVDDYPAQSVDCLLTTLQGGSSSRSRPRTRPKFVPLPRAPGTSLRRVRSSPELTRHIRSDDSMQIPFRFRTKRSRSVSRPADDGTSVHPLMGTMSSKAKIPEQTVLPESQSFGQKLHSRFGTHKRDKVSTRAIGEKSRPALSALPSNWFSHSTPTDTSAHQRSLSQGSARLDALYEQQSSFGPGQYNLTDARFVPTRRAPSVPTSPEVSFLPSMHSEDIVSPLPPRTLKFVANTRRPESVMSASQSIMDVPVEAQTDEWARSVLEELEEARAALREAETWLWPTPPLRTPVVPPLESSMSTSASASTLNGPTTPPCIGAEKLEKWTVETHSAEPEVILEAKSVQTALAPSALNQGQGLNHENIRRYVEAQRAKTVSDASAFKAETEPQPLTSAVNANKPKPKPKALKVTKPISARSTQHTYVDLYGSGQGYNFRF
ncbi:hypothetical protein BD324DRAFT_618620 [Kockovaella imperatae]|uniref:Uncharacterized protein n=1 Tax=Kockovaella imperatae TaxID=4999 RepID=A0A1Y1UNM8_9TREE|nr:hypothetical protein BD324DRAFT_618620 [Kockovaella imperatae]ORX39137.1 hypothetical protein BD324DRAFT_618620 [Kockovaella imperatae]